MGVSGFGCGECFFLILVWILKNDVIRFVRVPVHGFFGVCRNL